MYQKLLNSIDNDFWPSCWEKIILLVLMAEQNVVRNKTAENTNGLYKVKNK